MARAFDFLISIQNSDGGWGYKRGGMSYVEPTAAVLLALARIGQDNQVAIMRGRDFLSQLQRADGGWGIAALDAESGWMTAWAVWALARDAQSVAARGAQWLLRVETLHTTDPAEVVRIRQVLKIDASLMGWPWQPNDAAWIFPTALTLLALNACGQAQQPRVTQGVRFLLDRAIPSGGWNIGNPFIGTGQMPATIVNTALVLCALRELSVSNDIVQNAQSWLSARLEKARTTAELAWGAWALAQPALTARLQSLQRADGSWDGNPFTTAVAMLAGAEDHI